MGIECGVAFLGVTVLDGVVGFSADIVRRAEISDADTGGGAAGSKSMIRRRNAGESDRAMVVVKTTTDSFSPGCGLEAP